MKRYGKFLFGFYEGYGVVGGFLVIGYLIKLSVLVRLLLYGGIGSLFDGLLDRNMG